jgi:methylated-DNA-[protein]-cysteine S-methyltransferase
VGEALVVVSDRGVREIRLRPDDADTPDRLPGFVRDDAALADIAAALRDLTIGNRRDFPYPLDIATGTEFQRRVWEEMRCIPWGQTASYGQIAQRVGSPNAMRAVGQACGRNPLPIAIPCHRVLAAGGAIGGYTGGLDIKRHLLEVEGTEVKNRGTAGQSG